MKKTFNKILSLLLAILMVGSVMSTVIFAMPYQEKTSNLTDDTRILYLDDFDLTDDETYTSKNDYTATAPNWLDTTKATVSGTTITNYDSSARSYYWYGVDTNIPYDANSQYIVEFYVKENLAHGIGLGWTNKWDENTKPANANQSTNGSQMFFMEDRGGTDDNPNTALGSVPSKNNGTLWTGELIREVQKQSDGYVRFIIVLDKNSVSFYAGSKCYTSSNAFNMENSDGYISLFILNQNDDRNKDFSAGAAVDVRDISVYNTAELETIKTNANNGDLLLELDNFDLTDGTTFTSNYDFTVNDPAWSDDAEKSSSVKGNKVICERDKNNWYTAGVETNIPLNATSKYTIEFYVKETSDHCVGLGWSAKETTAKDRQGFFFAERGGVNSDPTKSHNTLVNSLNGGWGNNTENINLWYTYNIPAKYADSEGFVRYTILIDGNKASLYVSGNLVAADVQYNSAIQDDHITLLCQNWPAPSQGTYEGQPADAHKSNAVHTPGDGIEIKNIKVWQGHTIRLNNAVAVLLDGTTQELEYGDDNMINAFPSITDGVAEDEVVVWTYSNNNAKNVIAVAPFEVTCDVTFTAKKVKISDNTLVGMQYTEVTDNKQNVRFISTIHSLKGSAVGFEITAKYMENGALAEQSWDKSCTYVYTSIKATSPSGTVSDITANELGGTYLFALSVDQVPTNIGQIDFYVRSYVVVNGEKIYNSETATTWTMVNGAIDRNATLLGNSAS